MFPDIRLKASQGRCQYKDNLNNNKNKWRFQAKKNTLEEKKKLPKGNSNISQ